jgi:TrmH family RNA methyltransferase
MNRIVLTSLPTWPLCTSNQIAPHSDRHRNTFEGPRSPLYNEPLHPDSERDRINIVLISPRNPLNIGAAARAMANFGFSRLTVVAPPEADPEANFDARWREARSAVGATEILQNARCTQSLAEAIAESTLVLGTGSLERRRPEQPVVPLTQIGFLFGPHLRSEPARGGRIALLFGPEKRGLTRDDLARCHTLIEIPTDSRQPSMNLGQAVAVCLYEIAARLDAQKPRPETESAQAGDSAHSSAASARLDLLAEVVQETMIAAGYSPAAMRTANRHDLELLLRRLKVTEPDARRILGLFRRILHRLKR